ACHGLPQLTIPRETNLSAPCLPYSADMVHSVLAALFRPPLSQSAGEPAQVEQVDQLLQADCRGVVTDSKLRAPVLELAAIPDISHAHADPHQVLTDFGNALDFHKLTVKVESGVHGNHVFSDTCPEASGNSGSLERYRRETEPCAVLNSLHKTG